MKITLTVAEVKTLIAAKLGLSVGAFELEVESTESRIAPIVAILDKVGNTWNSGAKILAIKELRTLAAPFISYGLWEAKTIMENIEVARAAVKQSGTWPMPLRSCNGQSFTWK